MAKGVARVQRVLVAVDASTTSRRAVLWAASEARLRRASLIITSTATWHAARPADAADVHTVLQASVAAACRREPSIAVGSQLLHGDINEHLITLSGSAAMIVLGTHQATDQPAAGLLGLVDDRVALQARCPIVIVPATDSNQSVGNPVVVGLGSDPAGRRALGAAAEEATLRTAALLVLILAAGANDQAATSPHSSRQLLRGATKRMGKDFSTIPTRIEYCYGPGPTSLLTSARDANLLVMSWPAALLSQHWRSVTAEAVRQARYPVMLVSPSSTTHYVAVMRCGR
jgi:nucleotide-binding universal stress UspA family protein